MSRQALVRKGPSCLHAYTTLQHSQLGKEHDIDPVFIHNPKGLLHAPSSTEQTDDRMLRMHSDKTD